MNLAGVIKSRKITWTLNVDCIREAKIQKYVFQRATLGSVTGRLEANRKDHKESGL